MKKSLMLTIIAVLIMTVTVVSGCGNNVTESVEENSGADENRQEITVDSEEYYNLNIHVSNFTEASLDSYEQGVYPADDLLRFAYQYNWFNIRGAVERAEDYYFMSLDKNFAYNVRVNEEYLSAALKKFFGENVTVGQLDGLHEVEEYVDGYYYSTETGGNMPMGFALLHKIEKSGDKYICSYRIYGAGNYDPFDREYYGWSHAQAESEFGDHSGTCEMHIKAADLKDRETYEILSYEFIGF